MLTIDVQFHDYVRPIRSSATNATALNQRLQNQAPKDLKPDEKEALALVDQTAENVRLVQAERDRLAPAKLRPLLTPFTNDWGALYEALLAKSRVSPEVSDVGPRSAALVASLFPDGVAFLLLPARGAWSEGFRRIERIEVEKLQKEIDHLVGREFVAGVQKTTHALGDALGMGEDPKVGSSSAALQDALAAFGRAVGAYGRTLAAHCDDADPVSVERFLKAVKPMDEHRAATHPSTSTASASAQEPAPAPAATPTQTSSGSTPAPAPTQTSGGNGNGNGSTPTPTPVPGNGSTNGDPNAA